jgi:3-methyladenine DNA glycosylase AlkD
MDHIKIINKLKSLKNPINVAGMARFGINPKFALGINIPTLRNLAKDIRKDQVFKNNQNKLHKLTIGLWKSKIHEARILASMMDPPELLTEKQMDGWIKDFNSWDLCDQTCMNLFWKHPSAFIKAKEWTKRSVEFERRAGFSLMAVLACHDKKAQNEKFEEFFPFIQKYSTDERNYVRKAVNWALRQIGKRNKELRNKAIKLSQKLVESENKTAKWIGNDALKELLNK